MCNKNIGNHKTGNNSWVIYFFCSGANLAFGKIAPKKSNLFSAFVRSGKKICHNNSDK